MRFYLSDERPRSLLIPCRFTAFGTREVTRGRGKRQQTKTIGVAWQGWNPDPVMEARSARLQGSGSFYWANAIRVLSAARFAMRADSSIHQIKIETISGQEIGRLYRVQTIAIATREAA